jgi:outer membrane protein assembly factor BamB
MNRIQTLTLACSLVAAFALAASADDWPMWGRTVNRNMSSPTAKNLPDTFNPGKYKKGTEEVDMATTKNVKWVVKLGSQAYGNPTMADGHVYVGTNNDLPDKDPRFPGDHSVLLCIDAKTGQRVWKLTVPKLGSGKVGDWEFLGIASSPTIDGDRVYIVTNRCEVMCLDAAGMANGNQGYQDEGAYMADLRTVAAGGKPVEVKSTDADILWKFDMGEELGVFPHNITSSSILVVGDKLFVDTSNGVDWGHTNIPSPTAPSLACLNKMTGELVGEEASHISERILHGNWSSPAYGEADSRGVVLFDGPDGRLYGFDPKPIPDPTDPQYNILKEVFRFDCVPAGYRFKVKDATWEQADGGKWRMKDPEFVLDSAGKRIPIKYQRPDGPSELIATPIFYKGRVYANIGQDPEHGEGSGNLVCIDPSMTGDLGVTGEGSKAEVWHYPKINRALSTPAIVDDLLYTADFSGYVYCIDANTGQLYWRHDSQAHIWGSPLVADGKVYIGNDDGIVTILAAGKEKKLLAEVEMDGPVESSPITANGVIYLCTPTHLFAIAKTE